MKDLLIDQINAEREMNTQDWIDVLEYLIFGGKKIDYPIKESKNITLKKHECDDEDCVRTYYDVIEN